MKLPSKAVQLLRGLGHALSAVVQIGKEGLSPALIAQTKSALVAHELIKLKLASESPLDRHETAEALATATDATLVQVIGRTFLLYRESAKKKDKISLSGKAPVAKKAVGKRLGGNRLGLKQRAKAKAAARPAKRDDKKSWGARELPAVPARGAAPAKREPARRGR